MLLLAEAVARTAAALGAGTVAASVAAAAASPRRASRAAERYRRARRAGGGPGASAGVAALRTAVAPLGSPGQPGSRSFTAAGALASGGAEADSSGPSACVGAASAVISQLRIK